MLEASAETAPGRPRSGTKGARHKVTMNEKLEQMLRIPPMNQIEIMTALEELLGPEPETEDDLASRGEVHANLGEAIEQTIECLKDLKKQGPLGSNTLAGQV